MRATKKNSRLSYGRNDSKYYDASKYLKKADKLFYLFLLLIMASACNTDNNDSSGNGAVIQGSNKDDYYQRRGFGDSIPSDSVREAKRLDSIRIEESNRSN